MLTLLLLICAKRVRIEVGLNLNESHMEPKWNLLLFLTCYPLTLLYISLRLYLDINCSNLRVHWSTLGPAPAVSYPGLQIQVKFPIVLLH